MNAFGNAIGESLAAQTQSQPDSPYALSGRGVRLGGSSTREAAGTADVVGTGVGAFTSRLGERALDRLDAVYDAAVAQSRRRTSANSDSTDVEMADSLPRYKLGGDAVLYPPTATDVPPVIVTGRRTISTAESYSLAASLAGEFAVLGYGSDPEYTAAIASGMGGIEGRIGRSVAPYVSTAATAPGRFKTSVLNDLDERGRVAATNGNYRTLAALGVAHTATNMLLPGSPQEIALTVGGGAVIGKVAPVVVGALNKLPVLGADVGQGLRSGAYWLGQGASDLAEQFLYRTGGLRYVVEPGGGVASSGFRPAPRSGLTFSTELVQQGENLQIELLSKQKFDRATGALIDARNARSDLLGRLGPDGTLFVDWYATSVPGRGVGTELLSRAIEGVGSENVSNVTARFGLTNAEAYRGALSSGLSPVEAAWQTPFGKSMSKLGFRDVDLRGSDIFSFSF
ncbi:MAG TPA: hypothetical protein VIN58_01240 [Roseateles sp.]